MCIAQSRETNALHNPIPGAAVGNARQQQAEPVHERRESELERGNQSAVWVPHDGEHLHMP